MFTCNKKVSRAKYSSHVGRHLSQEAEVTVENNDAGSLCSSARRDFALRAVSQPFLRFCCRISFNGPCAL